jgi:hypothetical protein
LPVAVEERVAAPAEPGEETAPPDVRLDDVTKRFDDVVAVDGLTL